MPEIEIRPVVSADLSILAAIDHTNTIEHVWQMDRSMQESQITINFREIRLPRQLRIENGHSTDQLIAEWKAETGMLLAAIKGQPVAYVCINDRMVPRAVWISDLAVQEKYRRQGIASALLLASEEWASQRGLKKMILEMHSKNTPAIRLALHLGFEFSGYNDQFYANQDIAFFFSRIIH